MQVDFSAHPESEHNLHLSSHAHYDHPGNHHSPAFSPFRHPAVPAIDPSLDQSSGANRNGHAPMTSVHQSPSSHLLQPDNASLNGNHLSHSFYGDMSRSSQTPSTPSNASPRFVPRSPTSQPNHIGSGFVPNDRPPPSRDVSDDTIDDAYANFILYCNPSFATTTDTSELTKLFRTPPKSDGKAFSTWVLFELIRKFDAKEIKTWTQLALDLGVEPPDTDKGQSTQKVQQYSVRLKVRSISISHHFTSLHPSIARAKTLHTCIPSRPFRSHFQVHASLQCKILLVASGSRTVFVIDGEPTFLPSTEPELIKRRYQFYEELTNERWSKQYPTIKKCYIHSKLA
jgi:hypothetical protein